MAADCIIWNTANIPRTVVDRIGLLPLHPGGVAINNVVLLGGSALRSDPSRFIFHL